MPHIQQKAVKPGEITLATISIASEERVGVTVVDCDVIGVHALAPDGQWSTATINCYGVIAGDETNLTPLFSLKPGSPAFHHQPVYTITGLIFKSEGTLDTGATTELQLNVIGYRGATASPPFPSIFKTPIYQPLDTTGDGTGTTNANGDYSGGGLGLTEFKIAPSAGQVFSIARMVVSLEDTKTLAANLYGKDITLANGIEVQVRNAAGALYDLTSGDPVITNADWGHFCYDVQVLNFGTNPSTEHLVVRWTFAKSGQSLILDGNAGEYLAVLLNDDLTGLISHMFEVQGFRVSG